MATRQSLRTVKVLHSGDTFTSCENFPSGVLPTERQVIERILYFKNFHTMDAANDVAKEVYNRWVWCNIYPLHQYSISKKIQALIKSFTRLDRWSKKKRGESFLSEESEFLSKVDKLFDVICIDEDQRRCLEKKHGLRMTDDDYSFYNDQKGQRIGKCLDSVVPLTSSDKLFMRRSYNQTDVPTSSSDRNEATAESTAGYVSHSGSTSSTTSQSSASSEFFPNSMEPCEQNRTKWTNLARMSERYQLSDRAAAAIANSVLQDVGLITEDNKTNVIDRSKLRRERERCRNEIREEEKENFQYVDALYFDGRKDATQTLLQGPNGKHRSVQLEEHYTVVGEPGHYYLTHFSPDDGKGRTIAQQLLKSFHGTELHNKVAIVGTDGTASMTGKYNGCIRGLEELLNKPLQWVICLLHTNELPLRHVFQVLDGSTNSPDTFAGPIGKNLSGDVSSWPVVEFKQISNSHFPELPQSVVDDLSTDQHYAYRICLAIILGTIDNDLRYLQVGPIVHSRWLTLGCRILRYYVSVEKPSSNLQSVVQFCLQVYFPTWFEIKSKSQLTCGSRNFFNLVRRITQFSNKVVRETALKVVQRNAFFAHPENVLVAMLGDSNEDIRRLGVNKVLSMRGKLPPFNIPNGNFKGGYVDSKNEEDVSEAQENVHVRQFHVPALNLRAKSYHNLVDLNCCHQQPPAIEHLTDIEQCRTKPLQLNHPCHNQCVERHVKLVTEAAAQVVGFERRDGLIRQKIKSRKLMKVFDTKMQFS